MMYRTFDWCLEGEEATEANARQLAQSDLLGESEITIQDIGHGQYVDTVRGVGIWYDYAADYYFFTDES